MFEEDAIDGGRVSGRLNGRRLQRGARLIVLVSVLAMLPSVGRADDVNITASTNNGLVLDGFSGTTARIMPGVTVSNTTFNFSCPVPPAPRRTLAGLCASTQAWTVTNQGTIATGTTGDGVHFSAGGSVVNMGSISGGSNAIWIQGGAGGSVDNQAGATIQGRFGAIVLGTFANPMPGAVTNAGTITSDGQAVGLTGGTVTNLGDRRHHWPWRRQRRVAGERREPHRQ